MYSTSVTGFNGFKGGLTLSLSENVLVVKSPAPSMATQQQHVTESDEQSEVCHVFVAT